MQPCVIAALRGISCFGLFQLWHCLNQRNKRKKKILSCGILSLSDVGSDVPGAEIKAAVSPFRCSILENGSTTLPQQHSVIFGVCFPLLQGEMDVGESAPWHSSYCALPLCWAASWVLIMTKGRRVRMPIVPLQPSSVTLCRAAKPPKKRKWAHETHILPPSFLFLAILKAVSVLLSLKTRVFVLMISSFNSSILVSPSNLYSRYQLLKEQVK